MVEEAAELISRGIPFSIFFPVISGQVLMAREGWKTKNNKKRKLSLKLILETLFKHFPTIYKHHSNLSVLPLILR